MRVALIVLELFTGVTGVIGGLLFVLQPDGSLLGADPTLLDGTPFVGWLVPGVLLLVVVGAGFLLTGAYQAARGPGCHFVSLVAGIGLVVFEIVEFTMIGFHPLQPLYLVVGVAVAVLALALAARERTAPAERVRAD